MRLAIAVLSLALPLGAGAQESTDAIILSIESSDPRVDPDALRTELAEQVELPVVGLVGSDTPVALIVVSVTRNGDASVIATARGASRRHTIERTREASWLRDGLAGIVETIRSEREVERPTRYALMSWSGGMRPRRDPELLRPWPWEAGRPASLRPSRVGGEIGSALSAPEPARRHQRFE